jgi:hypothetical protein
MMPPRTLPQLGQEPEGPSPLLPLAFFGSAVGWLLAGSAGLVIVAPDLAAGVYQQPRVFAVTHMFTLGVIASAIFGALHQFVPAVMGVPIRHPRVAWWGFWLTQAGVAVLVVSLWRWSPSLQSVAWVVLLAAVGCASMNTLPARRRAVRNRLVGLYASLGHSALGLAMLVAAVRIGDGLGWWHTPREGLLAVHFHLGAVGFGTLTAIGMTSRMLPAFLESEGTPDGALDWIGWVLAAGLVSYSAGQLTGVPGLTWLGAAGMLVSLVAHLAILARYFQRRTRRAFDPGLGFIAAASVGYLLAIVAGVGILAMAPRPGRAWMAYAVLGVVAWLVTLVIGVMHRVAPRIVAGYRARRGRVLTGADRAAALLDPRLGWAAWGTWVPGVYLQVLALLIDQPWLVGVGAWLMAAGALLVAIEAVGLAHRPAEAAP